MKNVHFEKYSVLIDEINRHTDFLSDIHHKYMQCKNGCDLCCLDFSIFPVEYHFILGELQKKDELPQLIDCPDKTTCSFLKNHSCTIYENRPVMCRTHGLPLIYTNEEGEFELSVCELNFNDFDFEDFTMENTLPQDKYNSKLFMLNRSFVNDFNDKKYNETDLIPMKNLAIDIKNIKTK